MNATAPSPITTRTDHFRPRAVRYLEPPPRINSADWLQSHVTMPAGTETSGMPFSLAAFPHVDGPLKAFDDPSIRMTILQWGTRLGKTTTALSLMALQAGTNPRNMMFASSTKESAGRVVASRLYPILASTDGVKDQLLPEHRRSKLEVRLGACRIFVGWSGSETSLADVGAVVGCAGEIDKWDAEASDEADSLALFLNRFKGFTNHKIILESTPTIKGHSRIEQWLHRSNRHRRYVPCPHCGEYQVLRKGNADRSGGFRWDHDAQGRSDPDVAYLTAYYECEACREKIENHHRIPMLRAGVWCPDGCTVDRQGQLVGTADRAGSDIIGFGPLPSWYALTETWGSFARAWIRAQRKPRDLQDVVNSYMAETWDVRPAKSNPERLADRIGGSHAKGTVPESTEFLTVTVDRQAAEGGSCPWVVLAHGPDDRCWEIDHGIARTLGELWTPVMRAEYAVGVQPSGCTVQAKARTPTMIPKVSGVDSGWNTKDTYDFCAINEDVVPVKGSSTDLGGAPYRFVLLHEGNTRTRQHRSPRPNQNQKLLHVNTDYWETDLQSRLDDKLREEPGSLTLSRESCSDLEFLTQLCNGILKDTIDARGNVSLKWIKKDETIPNDYRDCIRYGLCLAQWYRERDTVDRRMVQIPAHLLRGKHK